MALLKLLLRGIINLSNYLQFNPIEMYKVAIDDQKLLMELYM